MKPNPRITCAAAFLACVTVAQATTVTFNTPDFDRWNYPFNGTPGTRGSAPVFGAFNSTFDNRDGQFLIGFDTSSAVPALGPGQSYQINSATVTATHSTGSFAYDPTYDIYQTYLDISDPKFVADSDPGRPIVLTGAAVKTTVGYTSLAFSDFDTAAPPLYAEAETFGFGSPAAKDTRSAFAFDPNAVSGSNPFGNVSNNVDDGFDFTPWAVGQAPLSPGDTVSEANPGFSPGETFTFDINTVDAAIQSYLQTGLTNGGLFFSISSLHDTSMSGGSNPNLYTQDNFDPAAVPATLSLDYSIIPEPAAPALFALVAALMLTRIRRRS